MNQFKKMEVFVASEDSVERIGYSDEVEFWTYDNKPGELILHGFNAGRDDLLQAENECLRKDVEFYKNRSTVERTIEVERERKLEMGGSVLEDLLDDFGAGIYSLLEIAEELKITLVKPEPTEADKIQEIINDWNKTPTVGSLAQHLADAGFTVPDKENAVDA